jgi:branched-chain amino acid aminotransferase
MPLSMADRDGWIWYDGKLCPGVRHHARTHAFPALRLAVFEGVRAYKTVSGTQIYRLREHTQAGSSTRAIST